MTQFSTPAVLPPSCLSLAIASRSSSQAGFLSIAIPKAGNSVATCALHDLGPVPYFDKFPRQGEGPGCHLLY